MTESWSVSGGGAGGSVGSSSTASSAGGPVEAGTDHAALVPESRRRSPCHPFSASSTFTESVVQGPPGGCWRADAAARGPPPPPPPPRPTGIPKRSLGSSGVSPSTFRRLPEQTLRLQDISPVVAPGHTFDLGARIQMNQPSAFSRTSAAPPPPRIVSRRLPDATPGKFDFHAASLSQSQRRAQHSASAVDSYSGFMRDHRGGGRTVAAGGGAAVSAAAAGEVLGVSPLRGGLLGGGFGGRGGGGGGGGAGQGGGATMEDMDLTTAHERRPGSAASAGRTRPGADAAAVISRATVLKSKSRLTNNIASIMGAIAGPVRR